MIYTRNALVLLAESEALKYGVDPAVLCALVDTVSEWHPELVVSSPNSFNPSLAYQNYAESVINSSLIGLMQFSGQQARQLGYNQDMDGLLDPATNLEIGVKLLIQSIAASSGRLDRGIVILYGHGMAGKVPRLLSKIKPYQEFLTSPERPQSA